MRRSLRQRRERSRALVPVVDDGSIREPNRYERYELELLRQEEFDKATFNEVADAAIYHLISEPKITNALKTRLYQETIPRFADRLPPHIVRALVDATIRQEMALRADAKRLAGTKPGLVSQLNRASPTSPSP